MLVRQVKALKFLLFLAASLLLAPPAFVSASDTPVSKPSKIDILNLEDLRARLRFAPVTLQGGTRLTLVSPHEWAPLADQLSDSLRQTHGFFSRSLGDIPAFETTLRLMEEAAFYEGTGAPAWTNAMYYRNQIIIPLPSSRKVDLENLFRSIRHEYTHAVVHALSDGRCPGWLDEGIAQWIEGSENPALQPALLGWLEHHQPVPLRLLQGGFTKLDSYMVPAAYAQSLFAAQSVMKSYGLPKIRRYLDALKEGNSKARSFSSAFGISEKEFERRLGSQLAAWKKEKARRHRLP